MERILFSDFCQRKIIRIIKLRSNERYITIKIESGQALVTYTYNPSYSGGRELEDHGSKPPWAKSSQDRVSKKLITKKGLVEWLNQTLVQTPVLQKTY
jgi:hypothetical protein